MGRVLAAISIVMTAALAQGCLLGRSLYYMEDPGTEQEVNGTDADGGAGASAPGDKLKATADAGGGLADASPKPATDAAVPDAGPGPGPGPGPDGKPTCAGGTANERENNDALIAANPLAIGKTCGALTLGDTDWFTIDFGEKGDLHVAFTADGDGRLLAQSAAGGIVFVSGSGGDLNFTTNGKWNLRVVSDTGRAQTYFIVRQ